MYLKLLGAVHVNWEKGSPPRFRSQRTMALLGYLVAERRAISRDHLAALFWPDEDLAAGKANLRRELHNLAQILPGCWQTSRVEVAFVPGEDTAVDIIQFRQYETAGQWQAAADLIGGTFLEGVVLADNLEFESWLFGEQERWRQRCQLVLHHLIDHYKKQAKFTEALVYSRQLLQLTPWNEEGHRQVMFLLARTGQRSAALKQFGQCQKLLQEEFGVEVSAETMTLYEQIRRRQTFALHNIPALTTPFIGRERELSSLEAWLEDPQTRLITIMGPGGMGKTRLALALAQREAQAWEIPEEGEVRFPDGIYFVPLATSPDAAQLVTAVARALHFSLQVSDNRPPQEQLFDYLQNKHLLLILDNLEHLLEGIRILTDFLQAAPHLQIVTTSRARLQLQGEQVLDLKGLDYKAAQSESAAQLFLEVARRVQSDLQINEESRVHLNRICTLVQGMPLALELAASWVNILSLAEIAQEIEGNLDFLETSTRDLPVRHLSIRAVFDTSWQHLAPEEQNTYSQISVFVGGFTREAAQEVCKATLTLLSRLVNHSLLQYDPERGRYQMHELLRQYANSKLSILNKSELPPRHLSYFVNLVGAQIDQSKTGHIMEFGQWEVEFDNIQAALDWSVQNPSDAVNGMKLASALEEFWLGSQYNLSQVRQWLTDLISIEDTFIPLQTMAAAFRTLGRLEYLLSRQRQVAIEYCQQSLTILERLSDDKGRILTLCSLGQIERHHYHIDIAEDYYQQAYDIATRISDLWGQSTALHGLGAIAFQRGELDIAQAFADEGFSCARELGDDGRVAHLLVVSGMIATEKRQWEKARSLYEEALNVYRGINYIDGERVALAELGEIKRIECDYGEAEKLYQESLAIARDRGSPEGISIALYNLGQTLLMRNKLSEAFNFLDEGLNLAREQRDSVLTQCFIDALACLFASQRQFELALILWGAVDAAMKASSSDLDIADRLQHEHFVSMTKNVMDAAAFQNAWQKGQQMTLEEALILLKNGVATFPALL